MTTLTCPRCGTVFHFRPVDVELIQPRSLGPRPPAQPTLEPLVGDIVPVGVVQRHRQQTSEKRLSLVMALIVAAIVVAMILGGYFMFMRPRPGRQEREGRAEKASGTGASQDRFRLPPKNRSPARVAEQDTGTGQPPPMETFRGEHCELTVPDGVWTKFRASDEDGLGDLFLKSNEGATVLVLLFDKTPPTLKEATEMARNHVEANKMVEKNTYRLAPASDRQEPEAAEVGSQAGQVVTLKLLDGQQPRRFLLLAVVKAGAAVYAMRCECNWESRQKWEAPFRGLTRTFRVKNAQ